MRTRGILVAFFLCFSLSLFAEEPFQFKIEEVTYQIKGMTREFPLSQRVPVDTKRIFTSEAQLEVYMENLRVRLENERVLEKGSVEYRIGDEDAGGIRKVFVTIYTVDTWNIIALPYPSFDSNDGFTLKLKGKDYNFMGSMETLNVDLNYNVDNDGKSSITSNLSFAIPFKLRQFPASWDIDVSLEFPVDEKPYIDIGTGFSFKVPFLNTSFNFGLDHSFIFNDRDDDDILYEDDAFYLKDSFSVSLPFILNRFEYAGDLNWTPYGSISVRWVPGGVIDDTDLQGPAFSVGHKVSLSRIDWQGNYRKGFSFVVDNSYSVNIAHDTPLSSAISFSASGYTNWKRRAGINSRLKGLFNFNENTTDEPAQQMRGILNSRIDTDTAVYANLDLPVTVLSVDFVEVTGVAWTRFIGFEMQFSPFLDMALTHDLETDRYFSFQDAWYSTGLEVLVYPSRMRSIYVRASLGLDLEEMMKNGFNLSARAERDGASAREIFIGLGLHY